MNYFDKSSLPPSIPTNLQTSVFPSCFFLPNIDESHNYNNSEPLKIKRNECFHCHKIFTRNDHLKRHNKTFHQQQKLSFSCGKCGKNFNRSDNFKNHLKMHSKENPFICKNVICQMKFKNKASLDYHQLKHENAKFFCNYPGCGKGFFRENELKRHKKAKKCHLKALLVNKENKKNIGNFQDMVSEIYKMKENICN